MREKNAQSLPPVLPLSEQAKEKTGERRLYGTRRQIQPGTPVFKRKHYEFYCSLPADAQRLPAVRPVCRETVKQKAPGQTRFGGCLLPSFCFDVTISRFHVIGEWILTAALAVNLLQLFSCNRQTI